MEQLAPAELFSMEKIVCLPFAPKDLLINK